MRSSISAAKRAFADSWDVLKTLRGRSFDAVWDMQGLLRSGLMAAAARAPRKWGRRDSREGAGLFYTRSDRAARGARDPTTRSGSCRVFRKPWDWRPK